jgi:hypothetical protein
MQTVKQLMLRKDEHVYIFRYDNEDSLRDALVAQAKDERTNFEWFDAAVLSFRAKRK